MDRDAAERSSRAVARAAAQRAQVQIREAASADDALTVRGVLDDVFIMAPGEHEASVELLCAFAHSGQYLTVASDLADGRALAASMAFFYEPGRQALHSHATAVLDGARGRGVGRALKLHQRAWAIEHGVSSVTWTFDPLVRRNAWFNLARLGALPTAFEPQFYGEMTDGVNAGDESDRFMVSWDLMGPRVLAACHGNSDLLPVRRSRADTGPVLLVAGPNEEPVATPVPPGAISGGIQVPADIEKMRIADPPLSLRWRRHLRAALSGAQAAGLSVIGMEPDGWYVLGASESK